MLSHLRQVIGSVDESLMQKHIPKMEGDTGDAPSWGW